MYIMYTYTSVHSAGVASPGIWPMNDFREAPTKTAKPSLSLPSSSHTHTYIHTHTHQHTHMHMHIRTHTLSPSLPHAHTHTRVLIQLDLHHRGYGRYPMGWLRLVGSIKRQVSFAKQPYKRDNILQKRPII